MFDPKPFQKPQLIKDAIKEVLSSIWEGHELVNTEDGFIVTLYPQRNPYYEVRLFLGGGVPCVTRCHKYNNGISKEVI